MVIKNCKYPYRTVARAINITYQIFALEPKHKRWNFKTPSKEVLEFKIHNSILLYMSKDVVGRNKTRISPHTIFSMCLEHRMYQKIQMLLLDTL